MSSSTRKILVPTDFSDIAAAALETATSLARDAQAVLILAHVVEPPPPLNPTAVQPYAVSVQPPQAEAEMVKERQRQLDQTVPPSADVQYERRLVVGSPADAIVELAEEENVDLVVMGTHGRTGLRRLLMGSVAEAVVRRARCPVLTLKQPSSLLPDGPSGEEQ